MRGVKKWGIKINNWWCSGKDGDAIYYKRSDAVKDAEDFNSLRKKGDSPYTVEEYKK